jgi:hypothetical protein
MSDRPNDVFTPLRFALATGAAAGAVTVTGIAVGDKLICVLDMGAAGVNLLAEFTVSAANTIDNTSGTSTNGHLVLVIWESFAGGRTDARIPLGRSSY